MLGVPVLRRQLGIVVVPLERRDRRLTYADELRDLGLGQALELTCLEERRMQLLPFKSQ